MKPASESSWLYRLKAIGVIELVFVVMSFAGAFMPPRGSRQWIRLPPDTVTYVRRVLVSFGLLNGILVMIAVLLVLYRAVRRGRTVRRSR